jgi:ABC-type polysaccharide/polyol phosphate export permease
MEHAAPERGAAAPAVIINDAQGGSSLAAGLRELWQYRPLIFELLRRDLKLRYKNSMGGIAWSLANPLMTIAVITVMMKFIQARPIKDYSAYLFPIIFLWTFFQSALLDVTVCILTNGALIRKVYFPRAILPMMSVLTNFFHFGVAFGFTILYFFVLHTYPSQLRLEFLVVIPALFFLAVLALGLGYILSYLNVFYEDVRFIITSLLGLFLYAMPVFYTVEQVAAQPNPWIYRIYMLNPVAALLVTYQRALLSPPRVLASDGVTVLPPIGIPWPYFGIACVVSVLTLVIGYTLFERYQWEMVEKL